MYVDCMPTDGVLSIDEQTVDRMVQWASGPNKLKTDSRLFKVTKHLCNEVQLDFQR